MATKMKGIYKSFKFISQIFGDTSINLPSLLFFALTCRNFAYTQSYFLFSEGKSRQFRVNYVSAPKCVFVGKGETQDTFSRRRNHNPEKKNCSCDNRRHLFSRLAADDGSLVNWVLLSICSDKGEGDGYWVPNRCQARCSYWVGWLFWKCP